MGLYINWRTKAIIYLDQDHIALNMPKGRGRHRNLKPTELLVSTLNQIAYNHKSYDVKLLEAKYNRREECFTAITIQLGDSYLGNKDTIIYITVNSNIIKILQGNATINEILKTRVMRTIVGTRGFSYD